MNKRIKKSVNKYKNAITKINDKKFSSKLEAETYFYFNILEKSNYISDLILQPKYILQEGFNDKKYNFKEGKFKNYKYREISYVSDFEFKANGKTYTIEAKGFPDQKYPIKKKMFIKKYGDTHHFIEIRKKDQLFSLINNIKNKAL